MEPAVAAIRPPWPRGLPIQCLMGPINVAVDSAFNQMPFLADRAAEAIMIDPAVALVDATNDKEVRRAVGQFIDSFDVALAVYVMQCPPGQERDSKVYSAWSHAINALSYGRLSENEAELFWRSIFQKAIPQLDLPVSEIKFNIQYPVIPTDVDPREPSEWNPAALVPPEIESRELPATNLDCMIAAPRRLRWNARHDFCVPKPETKAIVAPPIWTPQRLREFRKIPKSVQEGMLATALLVESSKIEGPSRILALPFPSEFDVRYPSLFLDHEFLLSKDTLYPPAIVALSHFMKMVPSTLLLDVTGLALDSLSNIPSDSTKVASMERTAYRLLILLSKSDRPHLASNLIIRTILDRPDASSWHRQLLSTSFLRNLSPGKAQSTISLFASSILERLQHKRTSSSKQQKAEGSDTSLGRYVKVSTVKFLAQALNDADFVHPAFCVDILSKLLQTASHVDIRVAILDSMLSRLGRCADDPSSALAERLMSALQMAIPALGSLNERKQAQDADWIEAEKTGNLPEIYDDGGMQAFPPMLNVVLGAIASNGISSDILRTGLIRRIVLPVIEQSKEQSARWVKLFTLKHLPTDQSTRMPSLPVRPAILVYLIQKCPCEVPKHILDLYHQFILANISPSVGLIQLNSKVNSDIELRDSNEGQYWLSLYGQGADVSTSPIVGLLTQPWKSSVLSDGLRISDVQETVFEQAEALLETADESFRHWNKFIAALEPPVSQYRSEQDGKAWLTNGKPVILRIINRIDALRTPAWQRDRNRHPAVLPPTFGLRLWLLDYPQLHQSSSAAESCAVFAQQVVSVLRETLDLGLAFHATLDEVQSATSRCLPQDGRRVACCLGNIEPEDSATLQETLLRVELADAMLRKAALPQNKDDDILRSIRAMLEAWQECESEDVRMRGLRLGRHLMI